jgi:hypothetical protein
MTNEFPLCAVVDERTGKIVYGYAYYNDCERWRCDARGNWNYVVKTQEEIKKSIKIVH